MRDLLTLKRSAGSKKQINESASKTHNKEESPHKVEWVFDFALRPTICLLRYKNLYIRGGFAMKSFVVTLVFIFTQSALAAFMIEPNLSYTSGSLKGTDLSGDTLTPLNYSGPGVGLLVGYRWSGAWTALEGTYLSGKGKSDSNTYDVTDTNLGAVLGLDASRFRIYAGYAPSSTFKIKDGTTSIETSYKGTAVKAGVGVFLRPRLTLNLEYINQSTSKISTSGFEFKASDLYGSLKNESFSLKLGYLF